MTDLKTLILDDATWYRGRGMSGSCLRHTDGQMCCLGFLALACGATSEDIELEAMPEDVPEIAWPAGLLETFGVAMSDSRIGRTIAEINDDSTIDDATRLERLAPLFERLGYRLEFTKAREK